MRPAQLVAKQLEKVTGPGFESQVPPIFHVIFHCLIRRAYKAWRLPCALKAQSLDLQEARSEGYHVMIHQKP